ncbi:MAG: hypothetical protein J0M18_08850 [Ignavibacteria bacterium]|nr:hypothetical protein [Ignavibacteria bacterium]
MKDTKVIQILRALTQEEFKNFGKFVNSPYFNSSKNAVRFYNIIKRAYPKFEGKAIEIENVYKKLYPKQSYNEGTIRNIISEMGQLAEKFLSQEYYKDMDYVIKFGELNMLRSKNITGLKDKLLDSLLGKYGKAKGFMEDHFLVGIDLNNLKLFDVFDKGILHKNTDIYTRRTEFAMFFTLDYMIHSKLEVAMNESRNLEYVDYSAKMYDCFDFEKFLEYVRENSPEFYNIISIEHYVVKMCLNIDFDSNAEKFEKLFYEIYKNVSKRYLHSLFINFSNSYITQINKGTSASESKIYAKKFLALYDIYLKEKIYKVYYEWLPVEDFLNLIRISDIAGDFEKIKKYTENFKDYTHPDERENLYNFGMGKHYLGIENYEMALSSFMKIIRHPIRITFEIKSALIMCHFYLRNYETALSITDALMRDIERNKEGKVLLSQKISQVKYLKKLLKIATTPDLTGLDELENEIKKSSYKNNTKILKMINSIKKN